MCKPSGPTGRAVTAQGHPRTIFGRAIKSRNLVVAEMTARELGRLSLDESLALTALVACQEPAAAHHSQCGGSFGCSRRTTGCPSRRSH